MPATPTSRPDSPSPAAPLAPSGPSRKVAASEAIAFCLSRRNLRRTIAIALFVGVVLTLINQGSVIADGHSTTATWIRCALNFIVPFLVSNAGLLSAR